MFENDVAVCKTKSNKQEGPQDQDPESRHRKDTPDLLFTAINLSPAGEATHFPLSFYSHTSLTTSLSWNNSHFKFILCLIRSRFNLTKSFCWGYRLIILLSVSEEAQNHRVQNKHFNSALKK